MLILRIDEVHMQPRKILVLPNSSPWPWKLDPLHATVGDEDKEQLLWKGDWKTIEEVRTHLKQSLPLDRLPEWRSFIGKFSAPRVMFQPFPQQKPFFPFRTSNCHLVLSVYERSLCSWSNGFSTGACLECLFRVPKATFLNYANGGSGNGRLDFTEKLHKQQASRSTRKTTLLRAGARHCSKETTSASSPSCLFRLSIRPTENRFLQQQRLNSKLDHGSKQELVGRKQQAARKAWLQGLESTV